MKSKESAYKSFIANQNARSDLTTRSAPVTNTMYYGIVKSVTDPLSQGRIKVQIPGVDGNNPIDPDKLPWCYYLFASNIQHIPKVDERVLIVLENPWKKNVGRWWIGPVLPNRNVSIPIDSIALSARPGNAIELKDNRDVILTTDSANNAQETPRRTEEVTLHLDHEGKRLTLDADQILLSSTNDATIEGETDGFSMPRGERLVELLDFMLEYMLLHTHPPNNKPIPVFEARIQSYRRQLERWLLNNKVRHKGSYEG